MSIRSNPFEEFERLFDRLGRQIEATTRDWETEDPFDLLPTGVESMAVDLAEHDEEFVVAVDLPGFERDEVDVRMTDLTLTIEADHEEATEESDADYLRRERRHESLTRSLRLPAEVDPEGVTARMQNGVLTLSIPKVDTDEATRIDID